MYALLGFYEMIEVSLWGNLPSRVGHKKVEPRAPLRAREGSHTASIPAVTHPRGAIRGGGNAMAVVAMITVRVWYAVSAEARWWTE